MKYIVLNRFRDRFNNMKICEVGDQHEPQNDERAEQLIRQGFIAPVADDSGLDERLKSLGGGYYELPNGEKVRGKDNAVEALKAIEEAAAAKADDAK